MSASIFHEKNGPPDNRQLTEALGDTATLLTKLEDFLRQHSAAVRQEWKFYGKNTGWLLKLFAGKRNLVFVIPGQGSFSVAITLGEKAFQYLMVSKLPAPIKKEFSQVKKYVEGRTLPLEITSPETLEPVLQLLKIKLDY